MTIKTFGKFEIFELKDTEFSPKEREILTYIVSKKCNISIEKIIDEIWMDSDEICSRKNLTVYFSKINKKIKKVGKIQTKNSVVFLETDHLSIDFEIFESLVKKFVESGEDRIIGLKAFEIYGGDFLPGINSNWVLTTRYFYEDLFFELVKLLVEKENDNFQKLIFIKKIIDTGNNFDNIIRILNTTQNNKIDAKYFVDENIFKLIYLKDKLMRHPRFIAISITFENDFDLLKYLRKGDFAAKISNKTFQVLLEKDPKKTATSELNAFKKRIKKNGGIIKSTKPLN
ncbi:MAG: hypothetical protein H0Z24_02350 [Thermosipho sp. (in: Bacteria)]|nr:hypothetical protein [Thermosipho sp. (in: thermotogales)]